MLLLDRIEADRDMHLTELLQRWRLEAQALSSVLSEAQAELEHWQDEGRLRLLSERAPEPMVQQRCELLQGYCDELATELTHVRLALTGIEDERRHQLRGHLARPA